jgi:hypothetical protein
VLTETSITVFYLICGVLLLWNLIRGWRAGPARMAVAFGAIAAGYLAGLLAGDLLVPLLRAVLGFPDIVLLGLGRIIAGSVGYFLVLGIGSILFKRTSQQGVGVLRLLYGLSGALLGLLFGVCVVWALIISVRLLGALAEGRLGAPEFSGAAETAGVTSTLATHVLETSLAWKKELESGAIGPVVKVADPLPPGDYERVNRLGRVLARPEAMRRFLEAPTVKPIVRDPRFQALVSNPEISKLAAQASYAGLLRQPKVVEFLNDPAVLAKVKEVDWDAALLYAAPEKPSPTPP